MKANNCMICRVPQRARLIEADWAGGLSGAAIAKGMTEAGWPVGADTVLKHMKHVPMASTRQNVPAGVSKRDGALFVRNALMDEYERRERMYEAAVEDAGDDPDLLAMAERLRPDVLHKDLQPALGTILKAEAVIEKRADNSTKNKISLFQLMLGGPDGHGMLAPVGLIGDGRIIEGEFEEKSTNDDE